MGIAEYYIRQPYYDKYELFLSRQMCGYLSILPFSICLIHSRMYAQFNSLVSGLPYIRLHTTCPTCIHAHVRIQVGSYKHAKLIIIYYYCMSVCVCCSTGLICSESISPSQQFDLSPQAVHLHLVAIGLYWFPQ